MVFPESQNVNLYSTDVQIYNIDRYQYRYIDRSIDIDIDIEIYVYESQKKKKHFKNISA